MHRSLAAFLAVCPFAPGCYCAHERGPDDAATIPDALPLDVAQPDAPSAIDTGEALPEGPAWIPIDVMAWSVAHERCEAREGQTLVLRLTFAMDGCDEPGNVRWTVDPMAREVRLSPFVWRRIGVPPCPPSTREVVRDVALRGTTLAAGTWTVVAPDGSRLSLEIGPGPPELTCTDCRTPGETCLVDMECEGERECVPIRGDIACAAQCASSCQPFSEVSGAPDLACATRLGTPQQCAEDPNFGWTCRTLDTACDVCPVGMACNTTYCDWTATPWPSDCRTDADCPEGRSCVELPGTFDRSCHVRCRGDHPCPLGERCGATETVCPTPKI